MVPRLVISSGSRHCQVLYINIVMIDRTVVHFKEPAIDPVVSKDGHPFHRCINSEDFINKDHGPC